MSRRIKLPMSRYSTQQTANVSRHHSVAVAWDSSLQGVMSGQLLSFTAAARAENSVGEEPLTRWTTGARPLGRTGGGGGREGEE